MIITKIKRLMPLITVFFLLSGYTSILIFLRSYFSMQAENFAGYIIAVITVFTVFIFLKEKHSRDSFYRLIFFLIMYIFFLASILKSSMINSSLTLYYVQRIVVFNILPFTAGFLAEPSLRKIGTRIWKRFSVFLLTINILAVIISLTTLVTKMNMQFRLGREANPQAFSMQVALAFIFGIEFLTRSMFSKIYFFIVGFSVVFFSANRGALIFYIFSIFFLIIIHLKNRGLAVLRLIKFRSAIILLIVSLILVLLIQKTYPILERAISTSQIRWKAAFTDSTLNYRNIGYRDALNVIKKAPFFGIFYYPLEVGSFAHNTFLDIWSRMGILSMISWLFFIYVVLKDALKNKITRSPLFYRISFASLLSLTLISFTFQSYLFGTELWFILGIITSFNGNA